MRFRIGIILLSLALALLLGFLLDGIGRARVIVAGRASNGVEFFVVQRFNRNFGEPFTTRFHYRTAAGQWAVPDWWTPDLIPK